MTQLMHYDAARLALAEAVKFDDVLAIKDVAKHAELYARQARDTELIERATEIKVRAERRAGQMLAAAKESGDRRGKGNPQLSNAGTFGLADIGITKNESSRWQKLAAVSDDQFEHAVAAAKEVAGEVTTAAMLRAAKADEPKAAETTKPAKPVAAPAPAAPVIAPEDEYTPLDEAQDHIHELQAMLAVANMGEVDPQDKDQAKNLIAELQEENRKLRANLKAVTTSRDTLMNELAMVKRQCISLQAKIKKAA